MSEPSDKPFDLNNPIEFGEALRLLWSSKEHHDCLTPEEQLGHFKSGMVSRWLMGKTTEGDKVALSSAIELFAWATALQEKKKE